jgi:phenylacetate-coenzyme A ligase PaaK-like adenylate-forming protein
LCVTEIDGRVDDMIVSENGSRIPSVNFYTVMSKIEGVILFQLFQKLDKSLYFKLVTNQKFDRGLLISLKYEIKKRVGNLPLEIKIVNEIPRDPITGKIRCVITEIK